MKKLKIQWKLVMTLGKKKLSEYDVPFDYALKILMAQAEPYTKGNLTASRRLEVLIRDNYTCQLCGRNEKDIPLNVHHILAEQKEGDASMDNLVTLCWFCHKREHGDMYTNIGSTRGAPPSFMIQEPSKGGVFSQGEPSLLRPENKD